MSESNYCSKYQKWGVLQAAIAREEANQAQLKQLQSERLAKEEERKSLEKERAERHRKYVIEQEMIRMQQITRAKKKKQNIIIAIVSTFAIAFIGIPLFLYLFTYLSILFDI